MDKPPLAPSITLASLGMSCQAAHQAARYAEAREGVSFAKGPLDWTVVPPERLADWLERDLDAPVPGEVVERRDHAWWPRGGLWFWHGYRVKEERDGATVRRLAIAETFGREREKLDHQRETIRRLDPRRTLFVWTNAQDNLDRSRWASGIYDPPEHGAFHLRIDAAQRIRAALEHFVGGPASILFLVRPDRTDGTGVPLDVEGSEWKGNDAAWDRALDVAIAQLRAKEPLTAGS